MNDLFDTIDDEKKDEKLALLYTSNKKNLVSVKTPVGQTNVVEIDEIVQQGGRGDQFYAPILLIKLAKKLTKEEISAMYIKIKLRFFLWQW